jgi:putative spermidine/putrescine transport system substrate-binding protein
VGATAGKTGTTGRLQLMTTTIRLAGLLLAGAAVLALPIATPAKAQDQMTIVSWGGAYQDSQREAYYKPFSKESGTKITEEEYNGEIAKIRAMVEAGDVTWDAVDVDTRTVLGGCDEGIFEPIDYAKLGIPKEKFVPGAAEECGIGTIVYSTIIAYDADKLKPGPTTIKDLFDLEKFPGKRALQKDPFVNLEWALVADGVAPADVYKVLGTPEGVDRAFKKLDTIKKQVVWWEAGAQPPQLLADGEVAITSAWNGRIFKAMKEDKKNFVIVWDAQMPDFDFWAIPKGAKNLDLSYKFLAYASDAKVMANQSKYISYGPTNVDAIPNIAPDVLKDLPTNPDNLKGALTLDSRFWADNRDELEKRFNAWLAQ